MSKEVMEQIRNKVAEAQSLIYEAESLADEHGLEFTMNLGGYGMGGTYMSEQYIEREELQYSEPGWNASSQSC